MLNLAYLTMSIVAVLATIVVTIPVLTQRFYSRRSLYACVVEGLLIQILAAAITYGIWMLSRNSLGPDVQNAYRHYWIAPFVLIALCMLITIAACMLKRSGTALQRRNGNA